MSLFRSVPLAAIAFAMLLFSAGARTEVGFPPPGLVVASVTYEVDWKKGPDGSLVLDSASATYEK